MDHFYLFIYLFFRLILVLCLRIWLMSVIQYIIGRCWKVFRLTKNCYFCQILIWLGWTFQHLLIWIWFIKIWHQSCPKFTGLVRFNQYDKTLISQALGYKCGAHNEYWIRFATVEICITSWSISTETPLAKKQFFPHIPID